MQSSSQYQRVYDQEEIFGVTVTKMCLQIYCCRLRANECPGPPGLSASMRFHGILHPMRSYTKPQKKN